MTNTFSADDYILLDETTYGSAVQALTGLQAILDRTPLDPSLRRKAILDAIAVMLDAIAAYRNSLPTDDDVAARIGLTPDEYRNS